VENKGKAPKQVEQNLVSTEEDEEDVATELESDLEIIANDLIGKLIGRKFKGHRMSALINSVLKAKGYTTYLSPEGPDKGVDILAAPEPMGFGSPRLCVQVKSSDSPIERVVLDQLIGAMQNFHAEQGLLVSWGGFKSSIEKEVANQFFRVRLWGQKEIIYELLSNYENLDEDLKAELPLKRIWTVTTGDLES
jgi:restriction system protein